MKRERGGAAEEDAYHLALTAVQGFIDQRGVDLAVTLIDRADYIKVSTRSRSADDAVVVARVFGGAGKPGEGGSVIRHAQRSLQTEVDRALRLLDSWRKSDLLDLVSKRRLGSL